MEQKRKTGEKGKKKQSGKQLGKHNKSGGKLCPNRRRKTNWAEYKNFQAKGFFPPFLKLQTPNARTPGPVGATCRAISRYVSSRSAGLQSNGTILAWVQDCKQADRCWQKRNSFSVDETIVLPWVYLSREDIFFILPY